MNRIILLGLVALVLVGCTASSGSGVDSSAVARACDFVRYWADSTGTVADPDSGVTTEDEVVALAKEAWPDTADRLKFVELYDNLTSDVSDAQYAVEAASFQQTYCQS